MTDFTTHTIETAPEGSKQTMEQIRKNMGMVPNMLAAVAESPSSLRAYMQLSGAIHGGTFNPTELQTVLLAASYDNECDYCMAAHTTMAQKQGVDQAVLDAVRANEPIADERLEALRQFTLKLVRQRGWVEDGDVQAFLDAGFTKGQVFEVIAGIALKTLSNYVNHIVHPEVDAPFAANKWEKHPANA